MVQCITTHTYTPFPLVAWVGWCETWTHHCSLATWKMFLFFERDNLKWVMSCVSNLIYVIKIQYKLKKRTLCMMVYWGNVCLSVCMSTSLFGEGYTTQNEIRNSNNLHQINLYLNNTNNTQIPKQWKSLLVLWCVCSIHFWYQCSKLPRDKGPSNRQ